MASGFPLILRGYAARITPPTKKGLCCGLFSHCGTGCWQGKGTGRGKKLSRTSRKLRRITGIGKGNFLLSTLALIFSGESFFAARKAAANFRGAENAGGRRKACISRRTTGSDFKGGVGGYGVALNFGRRAPVI